MATPTSPVIDPEKLKQLMAGGPNVPMVAPPLGGGAPASPQLPALNFKQRQALPLESPGVSTGTSAYYQNKLQRIDDQNANAAATPTSPLGKIGHTLSNIGNKALELMNIDTISGTQANRDARAAYDRGAIEKEQGRETEAKQQAAAQAYQTGELANKSRELDIMENRPNKENTPDQQAIDAKMKEINPQTNKPFTAYEARVQLAQDIEDTKPEKTPTDTPHTITMLGPDNKPYEYQYDPKGNYSDPHQGYGQWKKVGPAKPEANGGIIGTLTPLLGPNGQLMGTMNTKTGEIKPIASNPLTSGEGGAPAATVGRGAGLANTERNQFNAQVVNPARDIETNFQKATSAVDAYNKNPQTGAAGMVLFAQHLGTTLGGIKGAAIGEHSQALHADAIGLSDRISRWVDQNMTGQPLSQSQVRDFYQMIKETRDITWKLAASEAERRGQPVDFLPADLQKQLGGQSGQGGGAPKAGDVVDGFKFKGGDPSKPENWTK